VVLQAQGKYNIFQMQKRVLASIFFLGFLLRVVAIDKLPVGFTPDEASFGYDAYSILKTGKDQWGKPFPLVLESFGDFKSPLYAYLTIPSVGIFGLNKFVVRLPNAILGTMAVVAIWLLGSKLVNKKVGLIAAVLLAISPWHVMMSRGAFEANLITFFVPLGIYLFLEKKYNLSALVFGLTLFTYHSAKLIAPVVFVGLLLIFRFKKLVAIAIFAGFFALMLYTNSLGGGKRIAERSITAGALEEGAKVKIELIQSGMNPILARALHNKYQVTAKRFINNYIQYFSFRFLITKGPAETTYGMIPGLGVLTYVEMIGLVAFLVHLVIIIHFRSGMWLLIAWLLIAPVPAALATGVGYAANRAVAMIPALQILAAMGIYFLLGKYKKSVYIIAALGVIGLGIFLNKYIVESPEKSAKGMLAGNLEIAQELVGKSGNYDNMVVPRSWSEPHIYIAFAAKYDPLKYQEASGGWKYEEIGVNWVDQMPEYSLGKFTFK